MYKTKTFELGIEGTSGYHAPVNKEFSNLNGSIGATYSVNNKTTLRTNFAKGYRVPNLSNLHQMECMETDMRLGMRIYPQKIHLKRI